MAIDFPSSPSLNDTHSSGGIKWTWNGTSWEASALDTIIDAKGDLLVGSAADTLTRLAVGSDGYFLKANSGATYGVEWASIPTINNIDDVGDVDAASPSDGDLLQYDSGTSTWVAVSDPTFTGTVTLPSTTLITEDYYDFTASATLTLSTHQYKVIEANSSSAITITVPTNSAQAFPVGTVITIVRVGSGEVTISPDSGVTVNTSIGSRLRVQWSTATLRKRATDTWLLSGDLKV